MPNIHLFQLLKYDNLMFFFAVIPDSKLPVFELWTDDITSYLKRSPFAEFFTLFWLFIDKILNYENNH